MDNLTTLFSGLLISYNLGNTHLETLHEIYREPPGGTDSKEKKYAVAFGDYKKRMTPIVSGLRLMGFVVYIESVELFNKTKFYIRVEWDSGLQPIHPIELCTPMEINARVQREDTE